MVDIEKTRRTAWKCECKKAEVLDIICRAAGPGKPAGSLSSIPAARCLSHGQQGDFQVPSASQTASGPTQILCDASPFTQNNLRERSVAWAHWNERKGNSCPTWWYLYNLQLGFSGKLCEGKLLVMMFVLLFLNSCTHPPIRLIFNLLSWGYCKQSSTAK